MDDPQSSLTEAKAAAEREDKTQAELVDLDPVKAKTANEKLDLSKLAAAAAGLVFTEEAEDAKLAKPLSKTPPAEPASEKDGEVAITINKLWIVVVLTGLWLYFGHTIPVMILVVPGIAFLLFLIGWIKTVIIDKKEGPFSPASGYIWMALSFTALMAAVWYYFGGTKYIFP